MPSKTKKQARFMAMIANSPEAAKRTGVSQKVAREFHEADKSTGLLKGKRGFSTKKKRIRKGGK